MGQRNSTRSTVRMLWLLLLAATAVSNLPDASAAVDYATYTESSTGCQCWWDMTRDDCACCKEGVDARQCGHPVHMYCYKKSKEGCPGVPQKKWTLSNKGHPCYFQAEKSGDCAWCTDPGYQCGPGKRAGITSKLGNHCISGRNKKYCDSVVADCRHIPNACDPNAKCAKKRKLGKRVLYECKCKDGYTGNGIQCFDSDGNLSKDPKQIVELTMVLNSSYYVYPHQSGLFPVLPGSDELVSAMHAVESVCTSDDCEHLSVFTQSKSSHKRYHRLGSIPM